MGSNRFFRADCCITGSNRTFSTGREKSVRPHFLLKLVRRLPQAESGKTVSVVRNRGAMLSGISGNELPSIREYIGPGFGYGGQHADRRTVCCAKRVLEAGFAKMIRAGSSRVGGSITAKERSRTARLASLPLVASEAIASKYRSRTGDTTSNCRMLYPSELISP